MQTWSIIIKGLCLMIYGLFHGRKRVAEPQQTLGEVIEYLTENPGKMFVLRDKTAVMIYYPPNESVIVIDGDFNGDPNWCNFMLHKRLWEMHLMEEED